MRGGEARRVRGGEARRGEGRARRRGNKVRGKGKGREVNVEGAFLSFFLFGYFTLFWMYVS